jgi:hypothetical protein
VIGARRIGADGPFGRWLREAGHVERAGVVMVVAAVIALVGYSFVPPEQLTTMSPVGSVPPGAEAGVVAGGPGGAAAGPGAVDPGGSTGGAVPGGAAAGAGAGRGAGGGAGDGSVTTGAALTATDRGVTADEVRIGFLLLNPGGLDEAGFALGFRSDIEKVVDALVAEVNAEGGIHGRRLTAVTRKVDPTSQQDQIAACSYLLLDQKVFGVVDSATTIYSATQRCYTIDGQTPFTHSYPLSSEFMESSGGYDVAANRNLTRIAREWAAEARATGFLAGGETVGVLTDACEPSNSIIHSVLVPGLRDAGAGAVKVVQIDCDPAAAQSQVPSAVLQMKAAGVTHILMATVYVAVQNFLQSAEMQGYRPEYFVSDYDGMVNDYFAQGFPPAQWDRVRGITTLLFGAAAAGKPPAPGTTRCSDILRRHGLRGLDDIEVADAEAGAICEELDIMVRAARAAGPGLTRAGWARAVSTLGSIEAATVAAVGFAPGKHSGGDSITTVEWRRECRCYVQISDSRPGRY